MAAKMDSITSMRVAAWQCRECGYLAEYPAQGCRPAGHALTRIPAAVKRWWTCRHCSNQFATVGVRYPTTRCSKCALCVGCLMSISVSLPPCALSRAICASRQVLDPCARHSHQLTSQVPQYHHDLCDILSCNSARVAGASTRRLSSRRRPCCASRRDRKCRNLQTVRGCKPAALSTETSWAHSRRK